MYACFISYCHGQHELLRSFIEQLKNALKNELEPLMDEEVFIDEERLLPGYRFNEELAQAICQSVCMIVVYCPKYERHPYCLREFEGMRLVQAKRRALLGSKSFKTRDMIIPIVFRGDPPSEIKDNVHYCDFTKFTLADLDINKNSEYVKQIQRVARVIYDHYRSFEDAGVDVCGGCDKFQLPPEDKVVPWRPGGQKPSTPFPGREPQP
jgi:hypothetical protein